MNDDVKPWIRDAAFDCFDYANANRDGVIGSRNFQSIIARHAPKVDVKAIATRVSVECAKRLPIEANVEQGAQMLCVLAVIHTEIADELERALNHGK